MLSVPANRCVIVEPYRFHRDCLVDMVSRFDLFDDICQSGCADSALEQVPGHCDQLCGMLFLVGCTPYLRTLPLLKRIRSHCPNASIILLDKAPKHGCGLLVHRTPVHGFLTAFDSLRFIQEGIEQVLHGQAVHSPAVNDMICRSKRRQQLLVCREDFCGRAPCCFTEIEWLCFRSLAIGEDIGQLAEAVQLRPRSLHNVKYRLMSKLQVKRLVDLVYLAHRWGFDEI